MPKVLSYEAVVKGGVTAQTKLVVPIGASDPVAPADGWVWFNSTDGVLRYRGAGQTVDVNEVALDAEGVRDVVATALSAGHGIDIVVDDYGDTITLAVAGLTSADLSDFISAVRGAISVSDSATLDLSMSGGVLSGAVLDSPTVGGATPAQLRNVDTHTDGTTNKVFTATDRTKLAAVEEGATANAEDSYLVARANHTGTQTASTISDFQTAARSAISTTDSATLDLAYAGGVVSGEVLDSPTVGGNTPEDLRNTDTHTSGTNNKVFTAANQTKLNGIATGATANQTDAYLLDRANHSGSQTASTISDFTSAARASFSASDTLTADVNIAGGAISVDVLDSPTVGGRSTTYLLNVDNHVDGTTNHVFTAADDTKLTGIATGATANATDAHLLNRANHTGTQPASTISDLTTAVAGMTLDAATLNGQTAAQIQTAVTTAIVDSAPGTLDTLNELAASLGDDPNFATTVTNTLAARSRFFAAGLTGGAATEVVTHNLGTRRVLVQVFVNSGDYEEEEYIVRRTSANTITIVSEGGDIPAGREVVITTAA